MEKPVIPQVQVVVDNLTEYYLKPHAEAFPQVEVTMHVKEQFVMQMPLIKYVMNLITWELNGDYLHWKK